MVGEVFGSCDAVFELVEERNFERVRRTALYYFIPPEDNVFSMKAA